MDTCSRQVKLYCNALIDITLFNTWEFHLGNKEKAELISFPTMLEFSAYTCYLFILPSDISNTDTVSLKCYYVINSLNT